MKKLIMILLLLCTMIVSSQTFIFDSKLQSITKIDEKAFVEKNDIIFTFSQKTNTVLIKNNKNYSIYTVDSVNDKELYYQYNISNSKKDLKLLIYKNIKVITIINNEEELHCLITNVKQIN